MGKRYQFQFSAFAAIFLAALLLMLPLQWIGAMLLAIAVHECSHGIAIYLLGGNITKISIGGRGVTMETTGISGIREIICALAGPTGSILLLAVAPRFPRTAICGLIHGIYNLLPLFPMDGGRILRCILYSFFKPPVAGKILGWAQYVVIAVILTVGIILSCRFGFMPLLLAFLIFINNPLAKKPFWQYNRNIKTKRYIHDRITQKNSAHGAETCAIHGR